MEHEVLSAAQVEERLEDARARGLVDESLLAAAPPTPMQEQEPLEGKAPLPPRVDLSAFQTPNKTQMNRGTCYAFATVAAMEANVRRTFGRVVDLSEQYLFQVYKCSDPQALLPRTAVGFDTGSSLQGFAGNSNCVEAAYRVAVPLEASAPYIDQPELEAIRRAIPGANPAPGGAAEFSSQRQLDEFEWDEGVVPVMARLRANYRVTAFHQVGASRLDAQTELAAGREVVMDIPGHTMLVIGYDDPNSSWLIKNSWGEAGPFWAPYGSWFGTFQGGFCVDGVDQSYSSHHAAWLGRWRFRLGERHGDLFVHRVTDRRRGAGQAVPLDGEQTATLLGRVHFDDGTSRDVNGWVSGAGRSLTMFVAPDTALTSFGAQVGERVEVSLLDDLLRASSSPVLPGARATLSRLGAREQAYAPITVVGEGVSGVGRQPALATWGRDRLDVFLACTDGVAHCFYSDGDWHEWERRGGAATGTHPLPAAVGMGPARLDVVLLDTSGRVRHGWHDLPNGWGSWDDLGGGFAPGTTPAAFAWASGHPHVWAIASHGGSCSTFYEPAAGWQEWTATDPPGTRTLALGVAAAAEADGGMWLVSVDAATRRPVARHFDPHGGWSPWTDVGTLAARSVPAIAVTENPIQQPGRPPAMTPHIFWLPDDAAHTATLMHTFGRLGAMVTAELELTHATGVGVAATSWGGQRLDCVVTHELPDGDLYRVAELDHLWSDDAGAGFGREQLGVG